MVSLHRSMVSLHSAMASLHGATMSSIASFYDDLVNHQLAIVIFCDSYSSACQIYGFILPQGAFNKSTEVRCKILKKHILEKWICPSPRSQPDDPK
jgi:hypothetical protein